jgi:hypothetical protein
LKPSILARAAVAALMTATIASWQAMAPASAQTPSVPADGRPLVTIKDLMEKTITPATNTLWNVPEMPTDEDWQRLEEAAVTLLAAANVTALGGTGPLDATWVKQPAWRAFNQVLVDAGGAALAAVRKRDTEKLAAAGDVLYPPCEGCHLQFNPGVVGESQ